MVLVSRPWSSGFLRRGYPIFQPRSLSSQIYRGVVPFIAIQVLLLAGLWFVPELATYLPAKVFGRG